MPRESLGRISLPTRRVDGPLFSTPGGKPYSTTSAREDLTSVLTFCGLDTKLYKSHSFRIGVASEAALRGFSDAQIRLTHFDSIFRLPY